MTFKQVLHEVVTLIEKDRRVSYRAILRQFEEVDDEYLEVLRDASVFAHPIEPIELRFQWEGRVAASSRDDTGRDGHRRQGHIGGGAEPRRITVMFCDLADSTQLSQRLDTDDFREPLPAYKTSSAGVIHRYGGYFAQYLVDGLLVYFGWPRARENEAERAVLTAKRVVHTFGYVNAHK